MSTPPLVVIGGSAGGLDAAERLVAGLDPALAAAVVVVLHQAPGADDYVARRLADVTRLGVAMADDDDRLVAGRILVAPSDRHLRFEDGGVRVAFGPRVNRVRPAIDVAMRSAAAVHAARVVGVVLSGLLDDGMAGCDAIRRAGGAVLVQDPADARHPAMPQNALAVVAPYAVAPADALAAALADAVAGLPDDPGTAPPDVLTEARIDALATGDIDMTDQIGTPVPLSCPDCAGPMWEIDAGGPKRYRCHVGHGFSEASMLRAQEETVEESLWVALRTMEERARMLDRLAARSSTRAGDSYREQAEEARGHASRIRDLLAQRHPIGQLPPASDPQPTAPPARA